MEIKSVRITLYNEVMTHRVPLLLVNSNIVSHVRDWSSEVNDILLSRPTKNYGRPLKQLIQ